ncbi:MAG: hypothetical protein ACRDSP_19810 [Pseudonocardiaceae bacterium]
MTHVLAAGAIDSNLISWAVVAVLLGSGWYLMVCALFPWRACAWCDGGKKRNSSGRSWRDCRHCDGTGRRARVGRLLLTAMSNRHRGK